MPFNIKIIRSSSVNPQPTLFLSSEQVALWGLSPQVGEITLNYGTSQVLTRIAQAAGQPGLTGELVINGTVMDKLGLRPGQTLQLKKTPQDELDLGPLIGYFISTTRMVKLKAGIQDSIYRTFLDSARALGGEAFLFSVDDLDWTRLEVKGYSFHTALSGRLSATLYPLPKVIYNRCFGHKGIEETKRLVSSTGSHHGIAMINPLIKLTPDHYRSLQLKTNSQANPATLWGCPATARILMQKNYRGIWQYSGGAICLVASGEESASDHFFGNYLLADGLKDIFPADYRQIQSSLTDQARIAATGLEKNWPALGELEIHFGLSRRGEAWLKKVVTKPLKKYNIPFKGSAQAAPSISRPLHHCFRLAGFPLDREPRFRPNKPLQPAEHQPIIGVFESLDDLADLKVQRPRQEHLNLAQASAELGCITYHFSLPELAGTNCIQGWYYDLEKQKWLQKEFPWPQIFYNRATFDQSTERQAAKTFRKQLKKFGRTVFLNTRSVFGKGFTSTILEQLPLLQKYLPHNVINPSPLMVKKLLDRYQSVFIKTEYGSDYLGVVQISRSGGKYRLANKIFTEIFPTFNSVWSKMLNIIGFNPFVAQQGIPCLPYKSRPLNIRAILQKDGSGTWQAVLIKPWLARSGNDFGCSLPLIETLTNIFSSYPRAAILHAEVSYLALIVAKSLEAHAGPLGELGIDLVLDTSGHPWVIEVNGKTNKGFFLENENPDTVYRLYYNPLAYGCFLAIP